MRRESLVRAASHTLSRKRTQETAPKVPFTSKNLPYLHKEDQAQHRPGLTTGPQPTHLIRTGKPAAQRLCYQRDNDL
jgi:hypothetical protein